MAGKCLALLTVSILLTIAASDSICPSSAFLEKRNKAFEDVKNSIKKVVVLGGDDGGSKTDRELYEDIAAKLNRNATESDYVQYTVAVGEIAIAALQYCEAFDISKITTSDVITLINAFTSKLEDQELYEAKKLYGSLLCINSRQSSKRSTPTELHAFFNSLDGKMLDDLLFSVGLDEKDKTVEYSLAFVVDDTGSMSSEIDAVKRLIFGFIRTENKEPKRYILSTFNDPAEENTGPFIFNARVKEDLVLLKENVSALRAHDGGDCPEYGMTAIIETLTEVLPYSNIIVLTDAAAKDDQYKKTIIRTAKRKKNSIHFFLSSSSCVTANTSLQHYRDIANETEGIVVNSITDFDILTKFSNKLRAKLSVARVSDLRKRSSTISITFYASVFTESIDILFTKFSTNIAITIPEGNTISVSTLGSVASYSDDKPSPGKYTISSSREFEYSILLNSNLDVLFEHYGIKSINQVKGEYIRVVVSSTQFSKIKITSPVVLQLLSTTGALLNETTLTVCNGVFAGYITVPGVRYQYKLEGFDYKGYPFSSQKSSLYNPVPTPVTPTSVPKTNTCPCENGGTCVKFTRFGRIFTSCKCATGYRGRLCQEARFCSTLAPPRHGKNTCYLGDDGKPNPGDSCNVSCNDGYDQIGGFTRTCTVDGIWIGRGTVCINRVACPLLDAPSNGIIDCILGGGGEPNPGEYCSFSCDDGYELHGDTTRTCGNDGNWSGDSSVCTKKVHNPCTDSPCEHNCTVTNSSYSCQCKEGYFLAANNFSCVRCAESNFGRIYSTWHVALCNIKTEELICAGTAINDQWVLTSAGCVCSGVSKTSFSIRYGKQKTCYYDEHQEVKLTASKVYCYSRFKPDRLSTDFALVKLQSPIPLGTVKRLPPLCLPSYRIDKKDIVAGKQVIIFGWGRIGEKVPKDALIHSTGNITIANITECEQALEKSSTNHKRMICTTANTSIACNGNYGSGVIVISDSKLVLAAVVSKRTTSCGSDHSFIYHSKIRNAQFIEWSNNILNL